MSWNRIILTGLVGLVGAVILTALCLLMMVWKTIPVLVTNPDLCLGSLSVSASFLRSRNSHHDFWIRRIAASANPRAKYVALLINSGYPFFGAVYAAPFILLTGRLGLGTALAALSFIRFVSAIIFLPK